MSKTWIGDLWLDHYEPIFKKSPCSIVCLPGLHEGSWVFEPWLQASCAAGWDSWALNFRGHGESRPVENIGKVSVQDYVLDVLEVIAHLQNRVILVGHSLGGLVSLCAARRNQKVAGLVLVSSVPPRGIFPATSVASLKRYLRNPGYLKPFLFNRALPPNKGDMYDLVLNGLPEDQRAKVFKKFVPDSGLVVRQIGLGAMKVNPKDITCPVLVIGATEDRLMDVGIQKKIVKKYGAEYHELYGAHMLPIEMFNYVALDKILHWAAENVK